MMQREQICCSCGWFNHEADDCINELEFPNCEKGHMAESSVCDVEKKWRPIKEMQGREEETSAAPSRGRYISEKQLYKLPN